MYKVMQIIYANESHKTHAKALKSRSLCCVDKKFNFEKRGVKVTRFFVLKFLPFKVKLDSRF